MTALYALAEHCSYGALHDEMIRDPLVVGLQSAKMSEKLQLDSELTLEKAVTQVRQAEAIKQQQTLLRGEPGVQSHLPVGSINKGKPSQTPFTLRSLLLKGTNFYVFCDLEKFAKFKDRKIYAACASGAALYSMRTLRAR